MGTWGTAIFSDDLACDIRTRYRQLIGDGLTGPQATDALLEEHRELLSDADAAPVFWLALAATQWRCGRFEAKVQAQALEIISNGTDLARWRGEPKLLEKRKAVLAKLQETLLSPQPAERRIPKRFRDTCEWEIGEIIGYRLISGPLIMFRVIGYHEDFGGASPIFELLDWIGQEIPAREMIESAGIKVGHQGESQLAVGRVSKRELPRKRILRPGIILRAEQSVAFPFPATLWRWLDGELETRFGLK